MDHKEYTEVKENLAVIHADLKTITESLDGFRDVTLRRLDEQDERIRELEVFHAKYGANIERLGDDRLVVIDNQKAITNLRKFLWAIATTAGGALALTVLNLIIAEGEKL